MRLAFLVAIGSVFCTLHTSARAESINVVTDPRPAHQVVDLTGTLSTQDIAAIDAAAARAAAKGELLVVVVHSTDGVVPRHWTQNLFHRLVVDTWQRNRGVLLMAALTDRKAEIVVGDGFPNAVIGVTDAIMADVVVANFKAGAPGAALVEGARAIEERVISSEAMTREAPAIEHTLSPPADSDRPVDSHDPTNWLGGVAGLGGLALVVREILRRRPRTCARCNVRMGRLAEEEDDKHLEEGERTEERIGSVDYDVWSCPSCGEVLKTRWGTIFTQYSKCGGCRWRTLKSTSRTVRAATDHSSGLAEVTETCSHCSHRRTSMRTIPRVTRSSSSSSSSSRSGGGSSSGRGSSGSW